MTLLPFLVPIAHPCNGCRAKCPVQNFLNKIFCHDFLTHGVTGLTKSISLDGRKYDIACGQIDIGNALTELSARMATGVKQANGERAPEPMIDVQHVADAIVYMASLPIDVNIQFMTIMATKMPFIGRG